MTARTAGALAIALAIAVSAWAQPPGPAASPAPSRSASPVTTGPTGAATITPDMGPPLAPGIAQALERYLHLLRDPASKLDAIEAVRRELETELKKAPPPSAHDGHDHGSPAAPSPRAR